MASKRTYAFTIIAKIEEAVNAITKFSDGAQNKLDRINFNTAVSAIRDGFEIVRGVAESVFNTISSLMRTAIGEANEAEEANLKLANSLRLMGDLSDAALSRFDGVAKSIASVSKFTTDMVKSSAALAKQFKLTNVETERTIRVAADLAAIQGTTLEEATRKLAQTYNGFVDRDLAKVIPGLKSLGIQALVTGQAIDIIEKRVKGSAEALGNTFSGALFRAQEALNDIFETLGNVIIQNPAIIVGLNKIQEGFQELNKVLEANQTSMRDLVTDGFLLVIQAAAPFLEAFQRILNNVSFVKLQFDKFTATLGALGAALVSFLSGDGPGAGRSIFDALKEDLEELEVQFGKTVNARQDFFDPLIKKTKEIVASTTTAVNEARKLGGGIKQVGKEAVESLSGVAARMADLKDQFANHIEALSKDPVKVGFDLFISKKVDMTKNDAIALGAGIVNNMLKGVEGARQTLASIAGTVANYFLPGIGPVVEEITKALSYGPEAAVKMVREFREAVPGLVENIATAIPAVITSVIKDTPRIINKIIEMLPRVMDAWVKAIPDIITALIEAVPQIITTLAKSLPSLFVTAAKGFVDFFIKGFPQVVRALITAIVEGVPEIIKGFVGGMVGAADAFVDALMDAIKGVGGIFGDGKEGGDGFLGGVGDFFGDVVGGIGDFFGFAEGGRTPNDPRLIGDRGLVRIGPNEQVFRSDLTDRMERYLDRNEGGQDDGTPVVLQLTMNDRVFAEASYRVRRKGYRQ